MAIGIGISTCFGKTQPWTGPNDYWSTRYPSDLTLTVDSNTEITLDWTNNGTADYDSISIERSLDGSSYAEVHSMASGDTWQDTGLTGGTQYYYRLRYVKSGNYSAYSNVDNITTTHTPTDI